VVSSGEKEELEGGGRKVGEALEGGIFYSSLVGRSDDPSYTKNAHIIYHLFSNSIVTNKSRSRGYQDHRARVFSSHTWTGGSGKRRDFPRVNRMEVFVCVSAGNFIDHVGPFLSPNASSAAAHARVNVAVGRDHVPCRRPGSLVDAMAAARTVVLA
jgi:hypothetical protein